MGYIIWDRKEYIPQNTGAKTLISLTFDTLGYILWDIFPEQIESYAITAVRACTLLRRYAEK